MNWSTSRAKLAAHEAGLAWIWAGQPASAGSLSELVAGQPAVSKHSLSWSSQVKLGAGLNWSTS